MARKDLPSPGSPNFLARVREELHALLGKTGSDRDRALTLRDALETGVLVPGPGGSLVPGGGTGGSGKVEPYEPDLTPPPQPGAFTATPAFSHIIISQAQPAYTQGRGHGRTRVYGAQWVSGPLPVFADAVEVGSFAGTVWGMPSNPATTWHLWIKWESQDGAVSATPSGGTNGVVARTAQDTSSLLEAISGQIGTGQLASDLATPIGQIPGMLANILSNADAIAQEALDRAEAITAEATARTNAIAIEATAREDAYDALQQQIDIITSASSGDLSALIDAVNQERDARIQDVLEAENAASMAGGIITAALASEVSARSLADGALASANALTAAQAAGLSGALAAEVSARTLADGVLSASNAVTASHASGALAGIATEQQVRATQDAALASTSTGLAAAVGQSAAAVVSEATARASADSAQAQAQTTIAAQTALTSAAVVSLQSSMASADSAQANQIGSLAASTQNTAAALQTEQAVRASQDASLAAATTTLGANVGTNAAAIATEASARASADAAQAATSSTLGASAGGAIAAVQSEAIARATADAAQASSTTTLAASLGKSVAAIQAEATARTTADEAQAGYQTTVAAQTAANSAAVVSLQQASTSADAAQAGQINSVAASTAQAAAAVQSEASVRANDDGAQAARSDALAAQIGTSAAAIQVEQLVSVERDAALAQQTDTLSVAVGSNQAVIQTEITARASADAAQSSVVAVLATRTGENVAGIVTEQTARTTQDAALAQSINTTQATTGANIAAISAEQTSRTTADTALASQVNVVGAATANNAARISTEETARATQDAALASRNDALTAASANAVSSVITEQQARTSADNALAAQTSSMLAMVGSNAAGILAEQAVRASADVVQAQSSQALYALHGNNAAAITAEQVVRATDDAAQAARISTVGAELGAAAAAIKSEETARVTQDAAQAAILSGMTAQVEQSRADIVNLSAAAASNNEALASDISAVRAQMVGSYTGTDLASVSAGLLFQERNARASEDAALAQQITLLSAGAGEQFDYSNIWYFDASVEGWTRIPTTGTTLSAVGGWLRFVSAAGSVSNARILSPTGLNIDGSKYTQIRLRIRKIGSPVWTGRLYFITAADSTFDIAKSVIVPEPSYDSNGISVVTYNMPAGWAGQTITRIRLDASNTITEVDYFELDWLAIGRPSPGASSAQLTAEQIARADGDAAQAAARETLATQLRGGYSGTDLGALTAGLLFQEREARATADATEVSQREALSSKLTGQANPASLTIETLASGLLFDEKEARISADASQVSRIESLEAFKTDNEGTISGTAEALSTLTGTVSTISGGLDAQVTSSNALRARIEDGDLAQFSPFKSWEFVSDHAEWIAASSVITVLPNTLLVEQSAAQAGIRTASITAWQFVGSRHNKIRMRVRKTAGTGSWRGRLTYFNAVHPTLNTAYNKVAPDPALTVGGPWKIVEWDMEALTAGGTDWTDNTNTGLRFDLGTDIGDTFEIDWIAVGSRSAGLSQSALDSAAATAANAAATAQTSANAANAALADIASDSKLTPSEKKAVRSEWNVVAAEKDGINAQATTFGITTENTAYNNAFQALANYLNNNTVWSSGVPAWISDASLSTTTDIVGATFRTNWQTLYTARTALLNRIALKAKELADAAQATANTKASASAFDMLDTQVQHGTTGLAATATRVGALESTVNDPTTGVAATAAALTTTNTNVSNLAGTVSAQAGQITTIQSRIGGAAVIPHNFDAGLVEWTNARDGAPDAVPDAAGTIVTDDPDFGRCLEIDYFDAANERLCHKRVLTCTPGRIYKVTARFKIVTLPADGSVGINIRFFGQSASYTPTTNSSKAVTNYAATGVYELVETISSSSVSGSLIFPAASPYARVGLAIASAETGLVLRIERIQVEDITSLTSAVQIESAARATETGELFAKYTVKVDVAGHVSGYGLASTANNGAVVSQFGIRADQFFVAPPATSSATAPTTNLYKGMVWVDTSVTPNVTRYYTGSAWSTTPQALPFVVQTTPTTINGETVPPGVYFDNAYMARLVATRGQIGLLAVDDARIASVSVDKLTAGSVAVGQYIQSAGTYTDDGAPTWRIDGNGLAVFNNAVVRGTIFASQGAIGGWTIGSNYLQSTTYALGTSGTRFNSDGTGQIGGITIYSEGLGAGSTAYDTGAGAWVGRDGKFSLKSAINSLKWDGWTLQIVGGGTFSGALSAATGTFSGSLTADAVNAVNTINLAGNAVTVPVSTYTAGGTTVMLYSWTTVQSVTIDSGGQPVIIIGSAEVITTAPLYGFVRDSVNVRLLRNGGEIAQGVTTPGFPYVSTIDYPPGGSNTYQFQLSGITVDGTTTASKRSLIALGVKR